MVAWVATCTRGLSRWDGTGWTTWTTVQGLSDDYTLSVDEIDGRLWVGTAAGLALLDRATGMVTRWRHMPDDPRSLSGDRIQALFRDPQGRLWIGTVAGLTIYDPKAAAPGNSPFINKASSLDWSSNGHHGRLRGGAKFVEAHRPDGSTPTGTPG